MFKLNKLPTNDMVIKFKQYHPTSFVHYYTGCHLQQIL